MDAHALGRRYEAVIKVLEQHITRGDDGTFFLELTQPDVMAAEVQDPTVYKFLTASLNETNEKIRRGEIDANNIVLFSDPGIT